MKKAIIGIAVIVAAIGAAVFVVPWKEPPDHRPIVAAVQAANYCKEGAECKVTELVNASELAKLNALYKGYFDAGGRRCMTHEVETRDFSRISCELGKCVAATKGK
jgi:poly(3-hydroxyalkanoate) synthetase